jgi:hypothetical protein
MRFRRTDFAVMAAGGRPLSVSTNMLGVTALRCAHLQTRWATEVWAGHASPRDGSGPLVEVYPAAAMRAWGLQIAGYKNNPEIRYSVVAALTARLPSWLDLSGVVDRCLASDHVLDALVSALVAYAVMTGATRRAPAPEHDRALVEGWIHLPSRDLNRLPAWHQ